jgi:hypothetical protein
MSTIDRRRYAALYGPTAGDRLEDVVDPGAAAAHVPVRDLVQFQAGDGP